jgi:hypothetical protein
MTETNLARAAARLPIAPSPYPSGFFGSRSLLESLDLGLDGGGPLRVLLLGLIQRSLCLVDRLLTAFTLLLPGTLFARPFALAAPLLLFEGESGLSLRRLVDGARGRPFCPRTFRLAGGFRWPGTAKIGGQLGMFAEGSVGSNGTPENNARFLHGRGNHVRIVTFLRRALMEEIAVGPHASRAAFIDGAAIARSKKPSEV